MKFVKQDMGFHAAIAVLVIGLIVFFNIFGPVNGHSLTPNYIWMSAFDTQFEGGDLYPRWLYGNYGGAGSPAFYFYGPMPFWITSISNLLYCSSCLPGEVIMVGPSVMMGLASLSCYYFIKSFSDKRAAFAGALLYFFLPYHFTVDF